MKKTRLKRNTPLKRKRAIRKASGKMKTALAIYYVLRDEFLNNRPWCEVCAMRNGPLEPVRRSTEVHHRKGRGKNLNEVSTWMAICRAHHEEIHTHPRLARKNGWLA